MKPTRVILLVGTLVAAPTLVQSQSSELKQASKAFDKAGQAFIKAKAAQEKNDAEAAQEGFGEAARMLAEAQAALRRELQRYGYYETQSLREQGRLGAAWTLLRDLATQTDEPEIAEKARADIAEIVANLAQAERALLRVECGGERIQIKVTAADGDVSARDEPDIMGKWSPCASWNDERVVVPGRYRIDLRLTREPGPSAATSLNVDLDLGERETVAGHFAFAPPPDIYISGGGCGSTGFQKVPASEANPPSRR